MLKPKLDLCRSEWLELVFDDRNKEYGAYELRKHYDRTLLQALGFTSVFFISLFLGFSYFMTRQPAVPTGTVVTLRDPIVPPIIKTKPVDPPKPRTEPPVQHRTVAFPPPVVAPDPIAKNPPTLEEDKKSTIGQVNQDGMDGGNIDDYKSNTGGGAALTEDKTIYTTGTIEIMPQFPGGEVAWQKFLQKHLHYPPQAIDAGIGGKVFISFVVETDGHLSDITLVRGVGYGLDDEAIRVLYIAPKWTPGIQNGRKVRVRYTMPFNFQAPTDNN
jgi:periplasmic protein TonB